jgi:hypothetical protein
MTTVRVGASMASNVLEVLIWLRDNVGDSDLRRHFDSHATHYYGENWEARWCQFGAGWFMDVTFTDPKDATFFNLRWK